MHPGLTVVNTDLFELGSLAARQLLDAIRGVPTPMSLSLGLLAIRPIHAYDGSMEKLQILFPEPQLRRLRAIAGSQDRPVSELVRAAVDLWLSRQGKPNDSAAEEPPRYHCGAMNAAPTEFREIAYSDRTGL